MIVTTPALLPSEIGPASIINVAATFGSLWFSTTSIVIPLFNLYVMGSASEITGAGPGWGRFDRPSFPCAKTARDKRLIILYINIFFISILLMSANGYVSYFSF